MDTNDNDDKNLTCSGCGSIKACSDFYRNKNKKTGYESHCKVCSNHARKKRRERKGNRKKTTYNSVLDLDNVKFKEKYLELPVVDQKEVLKIFIEKVICLQSKKPQD